MMTQSHSGLSHFDSNVSGVSWSAVLAGAAGAAALSLILLLLGTAFGFAVVSPWLGGEGSVEAVGIGTVLWLTLTHVLAAALGGYLAGRLRVRWAGINPDETYFRDTVHGFLTWSLATLLTAALVTMAVGEALEQATGGDSGDAPSTNASNGLGLILGEERLAYYADKLFRPEAPDIEPAGEAVRNVAARMLGVALLTDQLRADDRQHLAQLVARHTALSLGEADERVGAIHGQLAETRGRLREATEDASAAAALMAGWMFVALLAAAFFASLAATFGGRHRDTRVDLEE